MAPHPGEGRLGPSEAASVVLDIGPHAGALVVYTGPDLDGAEIEIRPGGGAWRGTHTAVRRRHLRSGVVHAGVFGSLPGGTYDVRVRGGAGAGVSVEVRAGAVAEVTMVPADTGSPAR